MKQIRTKIENRHYGNSIVEGSDEQKPADRKGNNEVLKQKIADMEKAIDELSTALEEAEQLVKEILNNY